MKLSCMALTAPLDESVVTEKSGMPNPATPKRTSLPSMLPPQIRKSFAD